MLLPQAEDEKKWFQKCLANKELVEKIKKIKLVVCDVDGAMTDGHVYLTDDKYSVKGFSVQNGFIISRIIKNNLLHLALVSGRNDAVTTRRAKMYGIPDDMCFVGIDTKKIEKVREIQNNKQISKDETLFYGDDILDFETKSGVGLFANPANAPFYLQNQADIIIPREGGKHALRMLLDLILYVQEKHVVQNVIKEAL